MQEPLLEFYENIGMETQISLLKESNNYKILRKISFPQNTQVDIRQLPQYKSYTIHRGVYLDTETTGLSHNEDETIQLCMLPFIYGVAPNSCHAVIFGVYPAYIGFQEPTTPLPPEITKITGITTDMLIGQKLDVDQIEAYLNKSDIIIAHNSAFDRPFTHRISPHFKRKNWACSLTDIKWKEQGFESLKLRHIAADLGFYFDAHQADEDCYAGLAILLQVNENNTRPYTH